MSATGSGGARRLVVGLGVDGVVVLDEPPLVPFRLCSVSAAGKWRRQVALPEAAADVVRLLAERCEIVWVSAWSYLAHEALREVLELPERPWASLAVQFDPLDALAAYAAGRPWLLVTDQVALRAPAAAQVLVVDPRRGLGQWRLEEWRRLVDDAERQAR